MQELVFLLQRKEFASILSLKANESDKSENMVCAAVYKVGSLLIFCLSES